MILSVECPNTIDKVILIDAQGFIDGKGPSDIDDNVAKFGVNVLKSWPLRMLANLLSYKGHHHHHHHYYHHHHHYHYYHYHHHYYHIKI